MFYHCRSRGEKIYRRLCAEPIEILPDGSIPEVRMTSQGPGEPYGSGEPIPGYQACELHGGLHIPPDDRGEEAIRQIADGDRAVFRYVKSEAAFSSAALESEGRAHVTVLLDGAVAGEADIGQDGVSHIPLDGSAWSAREQELTVFRRVRNGLFRDVYRPGEPSAASCGAGPGAAAFCLYSSTICLMRPAGLMSSWMLPPRFSVSISAAI